MIRTISRDSNLPLEVDEIIDFLRERWNAAYDMQLVVRNKKLYIHIMWAYLEQQSFPLSENEYKSNLNNILETVNRLGLSGEFRSWLYFNKQKPTMGRPLVFLLKGNSSIDEFVL